MVLPKSNKISADNNLSNEQFKTFTCQIYESKLNYSAKEDFYHVVDKPLSKEEKTRLINKVFKPSTFTTWKEIEFQTSNITIIETLRSYTVYIDENDKINNDTELIKVIFGMLEDRFSGSLLTLEYLQKNHRYILELASSVLEKLDKKHIGNYILASDGKFKKKYIPLAMVLDKMVFELMLVRKYLDYKEKLMTISDVMGELVFTKIKATSNDYNNKMSLRELHYFGYTIGRANSLLLSVRNGNIQLPIIASKWLAYDNIIKNTCYRNEWHAIINTLNYMLVDEDSLNIYKKLIGGNPEVLSKLRVPITYTAKEYRDAKSWIDSQKVKNTLLSVPKLIESPITIIAGTIAFLLSVNELIKAYNDMNKRH